MKKIRELCSATTLLIVLSLPAVAGDIGTGVTPPPPPPPATATATELDDTTTVGTQNSIESETILTGITLSLLQLLSVF